MRETSMNTKKYWVDLLNGMALGLFSSLIIGLILKQIGTWTGLDYLILFGQTAQLMMGAAIGAGVAHSVGASPLGIFAAASAGMIGAGTIHMDGGAFIIGPGPGEPVGALVAAWAGAEVANRIKGKTKVDIVLVPGITIIVGGFAGILVGPFVVKMMTGIGEIINLATTLHPLPMGILVAVLMGIALTLPISSAAIAISLGLSGLAAGAATVGCACQMIGFAVSSYRENKVGGLISQGLGTSMIQIGNIIKNPWIWLPPTLASAVLGPVSTVFLKMENIPVGAGMGTSGLVGQFGTVAAMGKGAIGMIVVMHFILPAALSLGMSEYLRKKGKIKLGDMKL